MKRYEGKEPCPGCGRTGIEVPRTSKSSLCYECEQNLKLGKQIGDYYGREYKTPQIDDLTKCSLPYNSIPIVYMKLRDFLITISRFEFKFARAGAKGLPENLLNKMEGYSNDNFVLPAETVDAAKDLCRTIYEKCREISDKEYYLRSEMRKVLEIERDKIYNEGIRHGRNLLLQLNNGEIGENDFFKEYHYNEGGGK